MNLREKMLSALRSEKRLLFFAAQQYDQVVKATDHGVYQGPRSSGWEDENNFILFGMTL